MDATSSKDVPTVAKNQSLVQKLIIQSYCDDCGYPYSEGSNSRNYISDDEKYPGLPGDPLRGIYMEF